MLKNVGRTLLHWLYVQLLGLASVWLQIAFSRYLGRHTFLFTWDYYEYNVPLYLLGMALYIAGYAWIWRNFLQKDWESLRDRAVGWKIGYVLLLIVNAPLMIFLYLALWLLVLDWGDISPNSMSYIGIFGMPLYLLLLPPAAWWLERRKQKRSNNIS